MSKINLSVWFRLDNVELSELENEIARFVNDIDNRKYAIEHLRHALEELIRQCAYKCIGNAMKEKYGNEVVEDRQKWLAEAEKIHPKLWDVKFRIEDK